MKLRFPSYPLEIVFRLDPVCPKGMSPRGGGVQRGQGQFAMT